MPLKSLTGLILIFVINNINLSKLNTKVSYSFYIFKHTTNKIQHNLKNLAKLTIFYIDISSFQYNPYI